MRPCGRQAWLVVVLVSENAADSAGRGGAGQYGPGGGTGSLCDEPVALEGRGVWVWTGVLESLARRGRGL